MIEFSKTASLIVYVTMFYLSVYLFSLYRKGDRYKFFSIISSCLLPSTLAGVRYGVGTDFFSYTSIFRMIRSSGVISFSFRQWIEPGFRLLIKIISIFGGDGLCFGVVAFLTILFFELGVIRFFDQYNDEKIAVNGEIVEHYEIALLIYLLCFFPISFNATRHVLAASVAFYAIQFVFSDKKRFWIFIFLACTFHLTALIALPVVLLVDNNNKKLNGIILMWFYIAFVGIVLFKDWAISFISRILHRFSSYGQASLANRDFWIKLLVIVLVTLYVRSISKNYRLWFNYHIFILAVILCILGFRMAYVKRVSLIYELALCLLVPAIPSLYFDPHNKFIVKIIINLGSIIYFILLFYISGSHGIFPYIIKF